MCTSALCVSGLLQLDVQLCHMLLGIASDFWQVLGTQSASWSLGQNLCLLSVEAAWAITPVSPRIIGLYGCYAAVLARNWLTFIEKVLL